MIQDIVCVNMACIVSSATANSHFPTVGVYFQSNYQLNSDLDDTYHQLKDFLTYAPFIVSDTLNCDTPNGFIMFHVNPCYSAYTVMLTIANITKNVTLRSFIWFNPDGTMNKLDPKTFV